MSLHYLHKFLDGCYTLDKSMCCSHELDLWLELMLDLLRRHGTIAGWLFWVGIVGTQKTRDAKGTTEAHANNTGNCPISA